MAIYPELLPVNDMVLFIPSSFTGLALLAIAQTTSSKSKLTFTSSYHESSTCPEHKSSINSPARYSLYASFEIALLPH